MTPHFDVLPYWRNLGATHAGLAQAQRHKASVITGFQPIRYRPVLHAYLQAFAGAMAKLDQAVAEREHIARRHRPD